MLSIKDLHVAVEGKEILKGVNLKMKSGEVHILMGKNGSGKSTLGLSIIRHPKYQITAGEMKFEALDLLSTKPDEIARAGILMSFQNPTEIEGVPAIELLKLAYNAKEQEKNKDFQPVDTFEFSSILYKHLQFLGIPTEFSDRPVNAGFSGGEKKKMEILQLLTLQPKLAIIDEIDSGLDVDALKIAGKGLNKLVKDGTSLLLITHYNRILKYLDKVDKVSIMKNGKIIKEGGPELVEEVEKKGFVE